MIGKEQIPRMQVGDFIQANQTMLRPEIPQEDKQLWEEASLVCDETASLPALLLQSNEKSKFIRRGTSLGFSNVRSKTQPRAKMTSGTRTSSRGKWSARAAACMGIFLLVCILRAIPAPFVQDALSGVRMAVNEDIDIDRTLGQLKFVSNIQNDVASVFSSESVTAVAMSAPARGRVSARFVSGRYDGIDIVMQEGEDVYCAADGIVQEIGSNEQWGNYIRVRHNERVQSVYANLSDVNVLVGDSVSAKQGIANPGKREDQVMMHFVLLIDDTAVDPLPYLQGEKVL